MLMWWRLIQTTKKSWSKTTHFLFWETMQLPSKIAKDFARVSDSSNEFEVFDHYYNSNDGEVWVVSDVIAQSVTFELPNGEIFSAAKEPWEGEINSILHPIAEKP